MMLRSQTRSLRTLFIATFCGFAATLGTGMIRNESGIGLPEIRHYGYPLAWLATNLNGPNEYLALNFALDAVFWIAVSLLTLVLLESIVPPV